MKLTRLEIYGFKSFAKKLDLKLADGITAIVGPNGCGKTNVVDAIRWVLGEQRPTQIRLERMEDILFKGSSSRRPLGMSEVNLTLENDAGRLPVDMPEITITRRLFRSGESDYQINKRSCRLADINDMLMDTGMGTDSYSVFELSMINSILSDKTEDRRHIFEEAAGVTKYKSRRKSALNKLINIEDDLNRVGDIIAELQRRVELLKRQAAKAKRYRTLKTEIKSRTIAVASFEIARQKERSAEVSKKLEKVQHDLESLRGKISMTNADIERLSVDIISVEKEIEENASHFQTSINTLSEKEKTLARLDSRLESLVEIIARARETSERNAAALEKLTESHTVCAANLSDVTDRLEKCISTYGKKDHAYHELQKKVAGESGSFAACEKDYHRIQQEIAAQKAKLDQLRIKREEHERRLDEINLRLKELRTSQMTLNEDHDRFHNQKLRYEEKERELSKHLNVIKKTFSDQTNELEMLDTRLQDALGRQAAIKAKRDFLSEVISSYEGYSEGVKNAVRAESLKDCVHGVIADIIVTDAQYIPAIKAALMERFQYILVDTTSDALAGARYLSEEVRGRAAFLPMKGSVSTSEQCAVPRVPGVIGMACDVVHAEARFMSVVRRLLDGVLIVDNLETALELYKHSNGMRYVTITGEMIGPHGDIHGGSVQDDHGNGALGRIEVLNKLTSALREVDSEVHNLQQRRNELSDDSVHLRRSIEEVGKALEQVYTEKAELSSSEAHSMGKKNTLIDTLRNLDAELDAIQKTRASTGTETATTIKYIETFEDTARHLGGKLEAITSGLEDLKTDLEKSRSDVNACEVERASLTEKKSFLTRELEVITDQKETLNQSYDRTLGEIQHAEQEYHEISETKKNLLEELERYAQNHEHLKTRKDAIEKRYADLRSERSTEERDLHILRREAERLSREESSLLLARDEAVMVMNNMIKRLSEDYFIRPEDIPEEPHDTEYNPETEKLILEELRYKLHSIGDVNLAAEADYDEEKKRLDFLESERNDLIEAGKTLKETITKINHIARARFMDTFERIRNNFHTIFQEFFEGGVCDLAIEEGIDPLEAEIQITARPPGKNVRSINLLSSGERALTAISLLFALYLVKPSPFCILDEVDAPLDDANINRYLRVIKEFSKKTQFIMVTHNKKTMAEADSLYGITMEEPGLSSLVSVRLSEVDSSGNGNGDS